MRQAGPGALPLHLATSLVSRSLDHAVPAVEHLLELGNRLGWMDGYLSGKVESRVLGAGSGRDTVNQSEA